MKKENIVMKLSNVKKSYMKDNKEINILNNVNIEFEKGKFYAIMGHSGVGKTTLVNILGLIDNDYIGEYEFFGNVVNKYKDNELSKLRLENIGFVFQDFLLNENMKVFENVIIPMLINKKINLHDRKIKAYSLLEKIGLRDRKDHFPKELSGGEKQRVSIARALANNPSIILADEPTGNLDIDSEKEIFELLKSLSNSGRCVIVVSHSQEVKNYANEVLEINDGKLVKLKK